MPQEAFWHGRYSACTLILSFKLLESDAMMKLTNYKSSSLVDIIIMLFCCRFGGWTQCKFSNTDMILSAILKESFPLSIMWDLRYVQFQHKVWHDPDSPNHVYSKQNHVQLSTRDACFTYTYNWYTSGSKHPYLLCVHRETSSYS